MKDRIFKGYNGVIKEISDTDRSLVALISTASRDRMNEVLDPEGADLENFRKNPVVLFAHNYRTPPVGKAIWIKQAVDGIIAKVQFATTQLAEDVFQLYKKGFMKAFSVGFIGKEWVDTDGEKDPRRTWTKWELVEFSAVPVPANPDALVLALKEIKSDVLKNEFQIEKYGEDIAASITKRFEGLSKKPGDDKSLLDEIQTLGNELIAMNHKYDSDILLKDKEIQDLKYSIYVLANKQRHEPDTLSEIADKDILKITEECIAGAIRHATGKVS